MDLAGNGYTTRMAHRDMQTQMASVKNRSSIFLQTFIVRLEIYYTHLRTAVGDGAALDDHGRDWASHIEAAASLQHGHTPSHAAWPFRCTSAMPTVGAGGRRLGHWRTSACPPSKCTLRSSSLPPKTPMSLPLVSPRVMMAPSPPPTSVKLRPASTSSGKTRRAHSAEERRSD